MKKIVIPYNKEQMDLTNNLVDGYIIGIKDMSVNTFYNIDIKKLDDLDYSKEIFISLNKNIENKDLDRLKDILLILNNYPIKGVLYSDVCFVNLKKQLKINYDLVWASEHLSTNYETINYWSNFGINYTYLSSDIKLSDILDIRLNTSVKLMTNIFGYLPMFVSKRHIVKNYLKKFNIKDDSDIHYIMKENKTYPIVDTNIGTFVYSNNLLNSLKEVNILEENGIEYGVINGFDIDSDIFLKIIKIINNVNKNNVIESIDEINKLIPNTDTGFMYLDTISKVKK